MTCEFRCVWISFAFGHGRPIYHAIITDYTIVQISIVLKM
jgi:hypothetical protein